jgi:hypothetical protein
MACYSEKEKVEICLDISNKLRNYKNKDNLTVNLFSESYTFVPKLKEIFQKYIKGISDVSGTLEFEEIGKQIVFHFPVTRKKKAKFVIKMESELN